MGSPKRSVYARLASRFAHLALGAKAEDEEEREDEHAEEEEEGRRAEEGEDKEKKAKKGKAPHSEERDEDEERADEEDGDGDEEEARAEEEDEDDDEEKAKRKKALCVVKAYGEGRAFERARWAAVMSSPEAHGRGPLACSLLTDTKMSADKIRAALAASPAATEARQGLAARMATVPRPDVGSGASAAPDRSTPKGRAAEIVGSYNKARGVAG